MKILKNILIIVILSLLNICTINAQTLDYKNVYMEFLKNYKVDKTDTEKVLFYDLNNDNTPEMILQRFETLGDDKNPVYNTICDIYTIKNNKLEKIHTIQNKTARLFYPYDIIDTIIFFITNNDKNLYYFLPDYNLNYSNLKYYKLNYDNNKVTSTLIGTFETKFFEDLSMKKLNINSDKYYYNNKQVSESEFLNNLRFKQTLNTISLKNIDNIEKTLNDYSNVPANPKHSNLTRDYWNGTDKVQYINYIAYTNGLYEIYENDIYLLMINGNIVPKANAIKENDKIYLPLRTICNYINKEIIYNNQNNTIKIENIYIDLKTGEILFDSDDNKVDIKNSNGITYISSDFFDKYLNFNIYNINKELMESNIIYLEDKSTKINYAPIEPLKEEINNLEFNNITKTKVNGVCDPIILGRYYFFKAHIDYYVGEEHVEQFDSDTYFIYDNHSNIKYW